MEIFLHLGAHRCANLTFHRFLAQNAAYLGKHAIAVWLPSRIRNGMMRGLTRAPQKISIEDERQAVRSIGRMRVELTRLERDGYRAVLISDPDLLGKLDENITATSLYPLLDERLMRLLPIFQNRSLRVGLSVRSYADFWASSLARGIVQGRRAPTADCLDFLTTQPRRWRHVIGDVGAAFPHAQVLAWPFERLAGQPERVLQTLCEMDLPELDMSIERVGSTSDIRELNRVMTNIGELPLVAGPVEKGARWMPFGIEHQRVLRAEYRHDLAWLQGGAQGIARYIDGRQMPALPALKKGDTHNDAAVFDPMSGRGQTDGIKKRMG